MSLAFLSDPAAVLKAMEQFDRIGRGAFLSQHGYGQAQNWYVRRGKKLYDSKAIAGVAVGIQLRRPPLRHDEFSGGAATVVPVLRNLGFDVIDIREDGVSAPPPRAKTFPPKWRLVSDERRSHRWFTAWRKAIASASDRADGRWWHERLRLRVEITGPRTRLATDQHRAVWTVEINEPGLPGDGNRLSGIAMDPEGRPWLVRQGRLQQGDRRAGQIGEGAFRATTGLAPAPVAVNSGPNDRMWFPVCRLDVGRAVILEETARFVTFCQLARDQHGPRPLPPNTLAVIQEVLAGPEVSGYLTAKARPPIPDRLIRKWHAEVWEALEAALGVLVKLRPAPGFEIDGLVRHPRTPVLIEIKTGNSASDIYEGIGQLLIYRQMLGLPARCRLVLLLPQWPSAPVGAALRSLGVTVSRYTREPDAGLVRFEPELLRLCGAPVSRRLPGRSRAA